MKTFIQFRSLTQNLLFILICSLFAVSANAQFERTFSQAFSATNDFPVGGKQLTANQFVLLSNAKPSGSGNRMVLTRSYSNGTPSERVTLFSDQHPTFQYQASALEVEQNASGQATAVYIVGTRIGAGSTSSSLFLAKASLSPFGQVAWIRMMDNSNQGNANFYYGEGISLELQTNGDVVVLGNYGSSVTGNFQNGIMAARFTSNGTLTWGYRYRFAAGKNYYASGSCNGTATLIGTVPTVAIAGRVVDNNAVPSTVRTLAFSLNANTGAEIFRTQIASGIANDEGCDIVQDPLSKNYMLVGRAWTSSVKNNLWVLNVNSVSGNPSTTGGTVYSIPGTTTNLLGRSVCLSVTDNSAVIGGYRNNFGCIIKLPFTDNATFAWAKQYPASALNLSNFNSGDIARVEALGSTTKGYLLTTDVTYSAYNAAHAVYVSTEGSNNVVCVPENFTANRFNSNSKTQLTTSKTAVGTISGQIVRETKTVTNIDCYIPFGAANGRSSEENTSGFDAEKGIKVFPNPVPVGQSFNLKFASETSGPVIFQLFDLTGKLHWESSETDLFESMTNIPTTGLPAGQYLLRVRTDKDLQTMKVVIGGN